MDHVANLIEITSIEECEPIFQREFAIIFKHSEVCDLSQIAYETVLGFCTEHPDAEIHLISVLDSREVARFVEDKTGIRHESPQILGTRNGIVFKHASHRKITPAFLKNVYEAGLTHI